MVTSIPAAPAQIGHESGLHFEFSRYNILVLRHPGIRIYYTHPLAADVQVRLVLSGGNTF